MIVLILILILILTNFQVLESSSIRILQFSCRKPSLHRPSAIDSSSCTITHHKHVVPLAHVMEMTDSHNQVTAVKYWMAKNPTDAAALITPQDTRKVLSQVTFSLNQASVANEFAIGIGIGIGRTGTLTCAHVVAAMTECIVSRKKMSPSAWLHM